MIAPHKEDGTTRPVQGHAGPSEAHPSPGDASRVRIAGAGRDGLATPLGTARVDEHHETMQPLNMMTAFMKTEIS